MRFKKTKPSPAKKQALQQFAGHVSSGKAAFFKKYGMDFVMGQRQGPWLYDMDGQKRLYNLHCNGGVFNLGHHHPQITATLQQALAHLDIGNHHLMSRQRAALAARLAELMPGDLSYTVFGVSGGEAIDLAIKVARGYTGRKKIISVSGGYHGHTGLAIQAGDQRYRQPFLLHNTDFIQVPFNDIEALHSALDDQTAAVLLETIPATLGMPLPAAGYLPQVASLCRQQGALLILDEVQAGLGRTGKLWAFEHFAVQPDIVVLGKGLSGGLYPISATVLDQRLEKVFHEDPFIHVSTFGGAEPGCVVADKVLEISSEPVFLDQVNHLATRWQEELDALQQKRSSIMAGHEGLGLMRALVLHDELAGPVLTKTAYDHDLLLIYANHDTRRVQFLPPLTMDESDIPMVAAQLDQALQQAQRLLPLVKLRRAVGKIFKRK